MEIREAKEEDIGAILALQTQIYRTEKIADGAEEALKNQLRDETCNVLIAQENGKIIATSTIYLIEVAIRNQPYALFEGLVVDKGERGKGTGTAMLNKMIEVARAKNCYKIIFTSGTDRLDAHKLYEKLGFKKWGLEFRMDL